jgi:hypothetical protein
MTQSPTAAAPQTDSAAASSGTESSEVAACPQREPQSTWLVASGAIALSFALLTLGRGHAASAGTSMPISITVVPADAVNLDCSSDTAFGDAGCNFDAQGRPQKVENPLRPYVTTGRELWLLSGVFEAPAVRQWLAQAQRIGSSARVTIDCQGTLLGTLSTIAVRWQTGAAFGNEHRVPVARVGSCRVAR